MVPTIAIEIQNDRCIIYSLMSLPKLYLETGPSQAISDGPAEPGFEACGRNQEGTEEWWEKQRNEYQLFVSEAVLDEAGHGDTRFAARRSRCSMVSRNCVRYRKLMLS